MIRLFCSSALVMFATAFSANANMSISLPYIQFPAEETQTTRADTTVVAPLPKVKNR